MSPGAATSCPCSMKPSNPVEFPVRLGNRLFLIQQGRSLVNEKGLIAFGPFRLDLPRQRLLKGGEDVHLRRKVWDVLSHLAQRPGVVVSSRDLIDDLWPDIAVTPNALTRVISELRQALGGKEASDAYLRTIPKRGFIFTAGDASASDASAASLAASGGDARGLIGRFDELAGLRRAWQLACIGQRQTVFVSGVPGVGKSTLVEAATREIVAAGGKVLVAKGQCLALQGESEPFLPVVEAVEQMLDEIGDAAFVDVARRYAPTWLVQMPWLIAAAELAELRGSLVSSGAQRVLRDAVRLIERIAEQSPILLIIEDMQWADASTLDLLVALAERSAEARVMVVATYRAIEVSLTGHPVGHAAHSLCSRGKAMALEVDAWSRRTVAEYLDQRFASPAITVAYADRIEAHTHGNPLFVRETTDHLVRSGHLHQVDGCWLHDQTKEPQNLSLPGSLRHTVDAWLMLQPAAIINALEAASLINAEFTVQEVAAALGQSDGEVDETLSEIERRSRLVELVGTGRWPDSTTTQAYRFSHALYQRAVSERVAPLRRGALHRGIAARLESGFHGEHGRVAARLAAHFEAGGDEDKCITYLTISAKVAKNRYAPGEAAAHIRKVIDILRKRPLSAEHQRHEASCWLEHGNLLHNAKGLGNSDSRAAFEHALSLADGLDDNGLRFGALIGLCFNLGFSGVLDRALQISLQMVALAQSWNRKLLPLSLLYTAMNETSLGHFQHARERVIAAMPMEGVSGLPEGWNLNLGCHVQAIVCQGLLGRTANLGAEMDHVLSRAQESKFPADRLIVWTYCAAVCAMHRDWSRTLALTAQVIPLADEMAQPSYRTLTRSLRARALAGDKPSGFIEELERQMREREMLCERWWNSWFFGWLAEAYLNVGDLDRALAQTDQALAHQELAFRSETWRIRGAVLEAMGRLGDVENSLQEGLRTARAQGAQVFALRSAVALSRWLKRQSRSAEARQLVKRISRECAQAHGSADYEEARKEVASA